MTSYDGLDIEQLCRLTGAPGVSLHDTVASTQDIAHQLGAAGAPSGAIVLADAQTAGRGRAGRSWQSPPGAGIWLSMVLRPDTPPAGGTLALRAGLAACRALNVATPALSTDLKWPNDIVSAGRKLGGILCEARWAQDRLSWIALGLGLNVLGPLPAGMEQQAAAIVDLDPQATRLGILEELVPRLAALAAAPAELTAAERAAFLQALWMPPGYGPVIGLEPDGALLVRRSDGSRERRTDAS